MSEEAKRRLPLGAEQPASGSAGKGPSAKGQHPEARTHDLLNACRPRRDDKKKDGGWFNKKARELEAVKAKLDAAEANAAQAKDQLLRMAAEYENYRKRSTRRSRPEVPTIGISFAGRTRSTSRFLDTLGRWQRNAPTIRTRTYKKGRAANERWTRPPRRWMPSMWRRSKRWASPLTPTS